ncbi:DNA-directed RNA polymerase subunit beta [bacterium]|nr:DNA-directed RNA polymerase subunit beta [bacterium]
MTELKNFAVQQDASDALELALIRHQKESFSRFRSEGIQSVLEEVFPADFEDSGIRLSLPSFGPKFFLEPSPDTVEECRMMGKTWSESLSIPVELFREETGEFKSQVLRIGNIPRMTRNGTFVVNGVEKVCVFQLIRSPGVFFAKPKPNKLPTVRLSPGKGNWLEFSIDAKDKVFVRLGRTRKFPLGVFLRAIGVDFISARKKKDLGRLTFSPQLGNPMDKHQRILVQANWAPKMDLVSEVLYERLPEPGKKVIDDCEGTSVNDDGFIVLKKRKVISEQVLKILESMDREGNAFCVIPVPDLKDRYLVRQGKRLDPVFAKVFGEDIPPSLRSREQCVLEIYLNFRPNDQLPTPETALDFIWRRFFEGDYYDLTEVGRFQINKKFGPNHPIPSSQRSLTVLDLFCALGLLFDSMEQDLEEDDIDHLGIRRVRGAGEMLVEELKKGMKGMLKMAREKSRTQDRDAQTPQSLIVPKLVLRPVDRFFRTGELVQFLDQTNPFAELVHKRKLSAMGPGGLSRRRSGFEVRDVHKTHYGRICPIETPEGANVGLITSLAVWAIIDEMGFVKTPYLKVKNGKVFGKNPHYFSALDEEDHFVAHASVHRENGRIIGASSKVEASAEDIRVSARHRREPRWVPLDEVDLVDYSAGQMVGISASLIPFLEHNDATRALMGANMLRQAAPILSPEPPQVATGMERYAAEESGYVAKALGPGVVMSVGATQVDGVPAVVVRYDTPRRPIGEAKGIKVKIHSYPLYRYHRSNQSTLIDQAPRVFAGDRIKKGQVLTDGPGIRDGELALGQNFTVAMMSLDGYNYEDSIVVSERVRKASLLDSVHIEKFEAVARRTRLGEEIITPDIPNEDGLLLGNLTEEGVIRVGTEVKSRDILVGKLTPKPEKERSPEERLVWKIINQKGSDMRNTSLRMPHGEGGTVIRVVELSKEDGGAELRPGVLKKVEVYVAIKRRLTVGDKLAGRHGNKGVVSIILPEEDMPFLEDGTPVDIILNPLGVPSRMNIGQLLELHLGWAGKKAKKGGWRAKVPVFNGPTIDTIQGLLVDSGENPDGKSVLFDGKTGRKLDSRVVVGVMNIMKLNHLAEGKIHARNIGPYSLITQQPLGGKARSGGQRFGEMEVWALEAYGASRTLQEMLTIKSDDIEGRNNAYKRMINGEPIPLSLKPESINNLDKEIRGLGFDLEFLTLRDVDIIDEENPEGEGAEGDEKEENNIPTPEGFPSEGAMTEKEKVGESPPTEVPVKVAPSADAIAEMEKVEGEDAPSDPPTKEPPSKGKMTEGKKENNDA